MSSDTTRRRFLQLLLVGSAPITTGCGTILYPERRGQPQGQLDWGVVLLDGVGLLLFVIPGLIAFAVDFSTGAIYLPPEGYGQNNQGHPELTRIRIPKHELTQKRVEQVVSTHTLQPVALVPGKYETRELDSVDEFWSIHDVLDAS